jgi:hypothetical protein
MQQFCPVINEAQNVCLDAQFVALEAQNVAVEAQFVAPEAQFVAVEAQNVAVPQDIITDDTGNETYKCEHCYKTFCRISSLKRHSAVCKDIVDPFQCPKCNKICSSRYAKSRHVATCNEQAIVVAEQTGNTQLAVPSQQAQTINNANTINQTNNNNNITMNIQINNFGSENKSHVTPEFLDACLRNIGSDGVQQYIEKIHLDPEVPENHNVRIKSRKRDQLSVRQKDSWLVRDKNHAIGHMIYNSCIDLGGRYLESPVKKEDEEIHFQYIIQKLMQIKNKSDLKLYSTLLRNIYASIETFEQHVHN